MEGIVRALGAGEDVVRWREAYGRVCTRARTGGVAGALRQLPADLTTFTGRDQELKVLLTVAQRAADTPGSGGTATVVISAIEGMAGVGKTQLALRAAHELVRRGRFRDVQLYVSLRGFDPQLPHRLTRRRFWTPFCSRWRFPPGRSRTAWRRARPCSATVSPARTR
ncbi:hypothetical protein ACQ4WX_00745 [Streptomyces lasalocidi]